MPNEERRRILAKRLSHLDRVHAQCRRDQVLAATNHFVTQRRIERLRRDRRLQFKMDETVLARNPLDLLDESRAALPYRRRRDAARPQFRVGTTIAPMPSGRPFNSAISRISPS